MPKFESIQAPETESALVKHEYDQVFTRDDGFYAFDAETVTIYPIGALLAEVGGKLVFWNPDANDGSEVLHGINTVQKVVPKEEPGKRGSILIRGPAVLAKEKVKWPDNISDDAKSNALIALAARHIVLR